MPSTASWGLPVPDWLQLVKSRLGPLGLDLQREAEIVAELAAHLEELAASCRQRGSSEEEATQLALASVSDWTALRKKIHSVEKRGSLMSDFRKRVWLPGIYSVVFFFLWAVVWHLLAPILLRPFLQSPDWRIAACFWCVTCMGLGAAAAYWSRRAGGRRRERIEAALVFPAAVTIVSTILLPIRPMMGIRILDPELGRYALFGILLPSAAVLLGTFPFLRRDPS